MLSLYFGSSPNPKAQMSVCFADSLFAIPVNLLLHLAEEWQILSSMIRKK
jgi:hypothetical protein